MIRDLRIDFLRGLVLLIIVADHVIHNDGRWFAFGEWVFCDCAAAFVFMSGMVCGMVYSRVLERDGFLAAQWKALRRVTQLFLAQTLMLVAVCLMFIAIGWTDSTHTEPFELATLFDHPRDTIFRALTLQYSPWLMDVLKLYMILLTVLPAMLWLYHRSRVLTLLLSFGVYAVAQKFPEITLYEYPHHLRWFWNPLGWQLVFFGAAALGCERSRGTLQLPRNIWLVLSALAGLGLLIMLCRVDQASQHAGREFLPWMWTDRQKLAPMHVIGFGLCAYLLSVFLRGDWDIWKRPAAQAVIRCGRHSLPVFFTGVLVSYGMSILLKPMHNHLAEATLIASGVGLTLLAGTVIDRWTTARKATETPKTGTAAFSGPRMMESIPAR